MPSFGTTSRQNLKTCDQRLQAVVRESVKHMDFAVICGHRPKQQQNKLFALEKTQLKYPNSKHNRYPSLAIDLAPYYQDSPHIRWHDYKGFIYLAGLIKGVATSMDINIRWGGDWDRDNDLLDQTFNDLPHFEIVNNI